MLRTRFQLLFLAAALGVGSLGLAAGVLAQPAPKPFTVTTSGLQIVYPASKPAGGAGASAFVVSPKGLSIVYPALKPAGGPAEKPFTLTTSGLKIIYPSPASKGKP